MHAALRFLDVLQGYLYNGWWTMPACWEKILQHDMISADVRAKYVTQCFKYHTSLWPSSSSLLRTRILWWMNMMYIMLWGKTHFGATNSHFESIVIALAFWVWLWSLDQPPSPLSKTNVSWIIWMQSRTSSMSSLVYWMVILAPLKVFMWEMRHYSAGKKSITHDPVKSS